MKKHFTLRNTAAALVAMVFLLVFSSCGDKNAKRFKEAAMNLDKTHQTLSGYDDWPETGIRNTGSHLASLISLDELQKLLPCPLYLSGPHHDGQWELYSDDFGHYNPKAIQYLADLAKKVVSDKKFVAASKPLVDQHLYYPMYGMMVFHDVMYSEELFDDEDRSEFFNDMVLNDGYSDGLYQFLDNINIEDEEYIYNIYNFEFIYFWARRYVDGTIDPFYDGLSTLFKAYYPGYQFSLEEYWAMHNGYGWFEGDEGWYYEGVDEETEYDWELEADKPVSDQERIKENDAVEMIRKAVSNLDNTSYVIADGMDYWPECGIRSTGGHLFSLISLRTLNRMLPCELYRDGPHHHNRWELHCSNGYGFYNPEAVNYLGNLAKKTVADKKFVEETRPLVDKYLKRQMLIMKKLYEGLNDPKLCPDKDQVMTDISTLGGHAYATSGEFLRAMEDQIEDGSYVYSNTGEMFLYWWARRYYDGTIEPFHDILETVYSAYYSI